MTVSAPGRANLIGEHIDYHGLPVLPIALERRVRIEFEPRADSLIHAESAGYGVRQFTWQPHLEPVARGDWENYIRAAAQAVAGRWGVGRGLDARITSDLPAAAGLSSSSALIVAVTLALLKANGIPARFEELMEVLPEGEHFVGTRGGGMDHAASLGSKRGHASLIRFRPIGIRHIPIPKDWCFLLAQSSVTAEKSGAAREGYNRARSHGSPEHVRTEADRVDRAVLALERGDAGAFGRLMLESHISLRDRLQVSCRELDDLVEAAIRSGALGARLTGAGFGGCVIVLCARGEREAVRRGLSTAIQVIDAEPADGALSGEAG